MSVQHVPRTKSRRTRKNWRTAPSGSET